MTITNRNTVSIVIVLLCGIALWIIPGQVEDGETSFATGAALLPDLAVSLILIFTLLDLLISFGKSVQSAANRKMAVAGDIALKGAQFSGVVIVAGVMALYAFVLLHLGYLVSSTLLLAFLMTCTGARHFSKLAVITVAAVCVLYLGMRYGFGVHLPVLPDLTVLKG
ncbi:tripartite tricarboxylate transporter TctB family protein [Hoeflea sp. TYP-13]|uniref:tripartite tricarboxylate transporter TctB family protein n=1 Tax=Hoeflea sp. TYP-13 TaxID=3230023 RepID=UPI0034C6D805